MNGPEKISSEKEYEILLTPLVKLLQQLSESSRRASGDFFQSDMEAIRRALELTSCTLFAVVEDPHFDGLKLSRMASVRNSEQAGQTFPAAAGAILEIPAQSELHGLLRQEQWVPLDEACLDKTPLTLRDLEEFCGSKDDLTCVLFPLVFAGEISGLLLMQRPLTVGGFSEELLDLGQVIARMVASGLNLQTSASADDAGLGGLSQPNFEASALPTVVLRRDSLAVERANLAARNLFDSGSKSLLGQPFKNVFPGSKNFLDALQQSLSRAVSNSCFSVSASDLKQIGCVAALVSLTGQSESLVCLQFIPRDFLNNADNELVGKPSAEESDAMDGVTKRLAFERWMRQTVCKLHSSLDRDYLLQTLADSLGRIFKATRCLVIRTDGPSQPMVTHEYVEPDLSPLGLGRTGQFPMFAVSLFQQKTLGINEVSQLKQSKHLSERDIDVLADSGIRAMAGAPLSHQGAQFGVVILVLSDQGRVWSEEDLETIEMTISQAAIALSHCQTYHQVKDQLFHMNLLGNLTQQLTNALEVAAKAPAAKPVGRLDERPILDDAPPLSSREMEVLKLIASGFANKEIAQRLFLTESTVELHASRIRKKLNLKSRTALVKYACDNSLV